MSCCIVLGAQWGDEGKGKVIDVLSAGAEVVVRFQGGANAGHTIHAGGEEVVVHLVPSGILRQRCVNVIGNGCVVDVQALAEEIAMLRGRGIPVDPGRLLVSPQAHLVTPMHRHLDALEGERIGTTGRGIGQAYADKARRTGIRMESLQDGTFEDRFEALAEHYRVLLDRVWGVEPDDFALPGRAAEVVRPFVADARSLVHQVASSGGNVLYEGAQGALLDIDHGSWPYVTSSSTTIGGALTGGGVYLEFGWRLGLVKAYTTRVGHGPFPTELHGEEGDLLREAGREYGATTGRPRRCGWLDLPLLRHAVRVDGLNHLALTKLDCLRGIDPVRVAVGRDGDRPVYEDLPGWTEDITGVRCFEDLPRTCRDYVEFVETHLGVPASIVSVGREREQTLAREVPW